MKWADLVRGFLRKPPPRTVGVRMYQSAKANRLTLGWGTMDTSADAELSISLRQLRGRSRALIRDAAYAKRAKVIMQNNIVGAGIGLQAQVMTTREKLNERVNWGIEREWLRWCRAASCHTGGALHFADFESMLIGQWFEAGESFVRRHYRAFGDSRVPLALEMIEAERLPDEMPQGVVGEGRLVRMCVEVDEFYRPVAYWMRERHPGERSVGKSMGWVRVPADQIWHVKLTTRWPQTRGEPPMHPVIRKLNDMDGYSEAEIVAARASACHMGIIKTPEPDSGLAGDATADAKELTFEEASWQHLGPGEDVVFHTPTRPNSAVDPFMRLMLREVAAGIGVSYESLSRDYAQSNYSSSRLALLDDRDLWRVMQQWFIRSFREPLHREWLRQAVLAGAIPEISREEYFLDPEKFEAVRFKPRGWSWIDPESEVDAYIRAIRAGLTTTTDVIAQTGEGDDIEDKLERRARELKLKKEIGEKYGVDLSVDTDPEKNAKGDPAEPETIEKKPQAPPDGAEMKDDEPASERVFHLRR